MKDCGEGGKRNPGMRKMWEGRVECLHEESPQRNKGGRGGGNVGTRLREVKFTNGKKSMKSGGLLTKKHLAEAKKRGGGVSLHGRGWASRVSYEKNKTS